MEIFGICAAIGVPSTVVGGIIGLFFHRLEKKIDADKLARQEQENARKKFERFQLKALTATMALCEANATALKNGKCNGETSSALEYMHTNKRDLREFLDDQGIDHMF